MTAVPEISDEDVRALALVLGIADAAPSDRAAVPAEQVLEALAALHRLRARLDVWEPRLIALAREAGVSWAQLAPVLGVASRQAAERRYLRLHQPEDGAEGTTRERVTAMMQSVAAVFEREIAARPQDWHMLQPLWDVDRDADRAGTAAGPAPR